jgi:Glycosyltransferase like family
VGRCGKRPYFRLIFHRVVSPKPVARKHRLKKVAALPYRKEREISLDEKKSKCPGLRSSNFMEWTVISATNSQDVLKSCLLNSPDIHEASEVILQRGYVSAATAFNSAIDRAQTDLLIFVHQDMYLPKGWLESVLRALDLLSKEDPEWGVVGVWGVNRSCYDGTGNIYCAVNGRLGDVFEGARQVRALDEVLLIMRKSSGLRFDQQLPGYHMYGTDICLAAGLRGMKSYVISAFCIHNTNGYQMLPLQFWQCYLYMRKKWRSKLPLATPCTEITFWCWPMIRWNVVRAANILLGRHRPHLRVDDPSRLYLDLMLSGGR